MPSAGEGNERPLVLAITSERFGDEQVLACRGDIDLANHEQLRACAERAAETDAQRIVVDLNEVRFVDTTALATLYRLTQRHGNRLCLRRPTPATKRVMQLSGLLPHLNLVE